MRHVRDHVAVTARRAGWSGQEVDVEDARLGSFAVRLPVLGDHQAGNLATALCALGSVGEDLGIGLTREAVVAGVEDIRLPGRLEVIQRRADSSPALVVDVAHNVQSVRAAIELVQGLHPGPVVLLFGCYGDKDTAGMLAAVPGDWRCVWTRAPAPRGLPAESLAAIAQEQNLRTEFASDDPTQCLHAARRIARRDALILAAGSFSTAGYIRRLAAGT